MYCAHCIIRAYSCHMSMNVGFVELSVVMEHVFERNIGKTWWDYVKMWRAWGLSQKDAQSRNEWSLGKIKRAPG